MEDYTNNLIAREPSRDEGSKRADTLLPHTRMELRPYQLFVKYRIHPFSTQKRFLLKLGTGLGKTLCALLAAKNFIDRDQIATIVTFTPHTFIEEINHFTELGLYLKHNQAKIQKFGYIELINNLFTEDLQTGSVIINKQLLLSLYNGIIIFDEIQNSYNKQSNNMWSKAILLLGKILENKTTMLFLSATPLLYSEEIGELMQLLTFEPKYDPRDSFDKIADFAEELQVKHAVSSIQTFIFSCIKDIPEISPSDENIKDVFRGKVCFIPESIGGDVPILKFNGITYQSIPNIVFDACEAPSHFSSSRISEVYRSLASSHHSVSVIKENKRANPDKMAFESMRHIQFVYDDEELQSVSRQSIAAQSLEGFIYLYEKGDPNALKWAESHGVVYNNKELTGSFLELKNIGKYSPKYAKALDIIINAQGKSFIYFNRIKTYGTDLICNMLKENGIIEHNEIPTATTLCFRCKHSFQDHDNSTANRHTFTPYKFFRITGKEGSSYLAPYQLFNSERNTDGSYLEIVVGSYRVVEGYTFKAVNNVIILSLPYNAANFIQVIGRAVRNQSHALLPPNWRFVNTHVLINSFKGNETKAFEQAVRQESIEDSLQNGARDITKDELDYYVKFRDFERVKRYEQLIHSVALDVPVYGSIYFKTSQDPDSDRLTYMLDSSLKMNPFQLDVENPVHKPVAFSKAEDLLNADLDSYYIAGASKDVVSTIKMVILSRFELSPVWRLDLLIQSIRNAYVFPSLQDVPESDIKLHIFNRRNVHIVGDYVCFLKSSDTQQNIFIGTERSEPPDVDFFLPRAKLRITPFSPNAEESEVHKLLLHLFDTISLKLPLVFISMIEGRRHADLTDEYITAALKLNTELRTTVNSIFQSHAPKSITDFLPAQFSFIKQGLMTYCSTHMVPIVSKNAKNVTITHHSIAEIKSCDKCKQYVAEVKKLAQSNPACIKLVFAFLTHTMLKFRHVYNVTEQDPAADNVIGYMNQQHTVLNVLEDGREIPVSFTGSLFVNYVFISYNKTKILIDGHKKICDKITSDEMSSIMTNAGMTLQSYESRKQFCHALVCHMWDIELKARLGFLVDKLVVWKA